ncbi:hypothetical protein KM22_00723 [Bordetella bronchiseptica KM22]|nr:hypothetical protein KM22_00723 [Bordetella bronchiseptica KM22]
MVEPPVWVASAAGAMKSATQAAEPPDEPPGVCCGACGLRVAGGAEWANSEVAVLPRMMPPAASMAATQ